METPTLIHEGNLNNNSGDISWKYDINISNLMAQWLTRQCFTMKFHKGETTRTLLGLASQGEAFGRAALVAIARQGGPLAVSEISFCAYSVLYLIMILPVQFAIFEVENTRKQCRRV